MSSSFDNDGRMTPYERYGRDLDDKHRQEQERLEREIARRTPKAERTYQAPVTTVSDTYSDYTPIYGGGRSSSANSSGAGCTGFLFALFAIAAIVFVLLNLVGSLL